MFLNKVGFLILTCNFVVKSRGLEELTSKADNVIFKTELILRNTINELFSELGFNKQGNQKIKQALLVHHYFIETTLKDQHTLNLVAEISRVNNHKWSGKSVQFTEILNEILNENWNSTDVDSFQNNESIIDDSLYKLVKFEENSRYKNRKLDIKDEIINFVKSKDPSKFYAARKYHATTISDDSSLSDQLWEPQAPRRIFQGTNTNINRFPFMASVHIYGFFYCAGSIIKLDLVLTAASCFGFELYPGYFLNNPGYITVRVGSDFVAVGGEEIPVMERYMYPYSMPHRSNTMTYPTHNIAVLRLVWHLDFTTGNKNINIIPIDEQDSPLPMTTKEVTIVGWGAKKSSNKITDPWRHQLSFAVLDVYQSELCKTIYNSIFELGTLELLTIANSSFCAGLIKTGTGACNHDVGDPGVVDGILTGIVSYGPAKCGEPGLPTVFTKVGYYATWIKKIMNQAPRIHKKTTLIAATLPAAKLLPHGTYTTSTDYWNLNGPYTEWNLPPWPFRESFSTTNKRERKEDFGSIVTEKLAMNLDIVTEKEKNVDKQQNISKRIHEIDINKYKTSESSDDSTEPETTKEDYLAIEENRTVSKRKTDLTHLDIDFKEPQASRRIFQGANADIKDFPFMASIHVFGYFYCAGSIIKSDLVLTAYSCIEVVWKKDFDRTRMPASLRPFVRVGSNSYIDGGEEIPVTEAYVSSNFYTWDYENNFAVLRLQRHLDFTNKNINMISIDEQDSQLPMNTKVTIVGWGAKERNNKMNDPRKSPLSFAVLNVYQQQLCMKLYPNIREYNAVKMYVTNLNFCAGIIKKGAGACNHDAGAPGLVNGILAGIVSVGPSNCGEPGYPTVFTRVGYIAPWIKNIMNQNASRNKTLVLDDKIDLMFKPHHYAPLLPHTNFPLLFKNPYSRTPTFYELYNEWARNKSNIPKKENETPSKNDKNKIKRVSEFYLNLVTEKGENDDKQQSISKVIDKIDMNSKKINSMSDDSTEAEAVKGDYLVTEENRTVTEREIGVTQLDTRFRGKSNNFDNKKQEDLKTSNILTLFYLTDHENGKNTLRDDIEDIDSHYSENLSIEDSGQISE